MRFPGRRRDRADRAHEQLSSQVICPVCGLRNDAMSRFCRNCGLPLGAPRDPVRGTTSRRADLPSDHGAGIAAIVGLLAAVVVLAGAGWLIFRSNSGDDGTAAGPIATPITTPGATRAPLATGGVLPTRAPTRSLEPGSSLEPGALPTRRPTGPDGPDATRSPGAPSLEPSAAPLVADTGFTCEAADFDDPTNGKWRITEALWGGRDKWDELTIVLQRTNGKGSTNVSVESMSAREAAQVTGLDAATSNRVLLITFDGDVVRNSEIVALPSGYRQIDYLNIVTTSEATYAIVGVNKNTCYRMFVPPWKNGKATAVGGTVKLLLDVKYR